MKDLFNTYKHEIQQYCEDNGLSFDKAENMCQSWDDESLYLLYHDPEKGKRGLLDDDTRMPIVLALYIREGQPVVEQTEYTRQYLG